MGASRRRRRRPLERAGDRIDRAGRSALLAAWAVLARALRIALTAVDRGGTPVWRWFARQRSVVRVAVVAALGFTAFAFYSRDAPLHIDDDAEALARVIRSEIGTGSLQQRLHVAWATRNLAAEHGTTIAEMACSPCGPQQRGRPVSSRQPALDQDRVLAREVVAADPILDPTGGATHFINPALQDQLARTGRPGYRDRPYRLVRQRWIDAYGWRPYYRLGDDLELWGSPR